MRSALASGKCVPVLCGAALQDAGVAALLDFLVSSAPTPGGEFKGSRNGQEVVRRVSAEEPTSCFVFKTAVDQFSGKLSLIKVMSGRVRSDSEMVNFRNSQKEKISKIYTCLGKKLEEVQEIVSGDLGILVKIDSAATNDTLGDSSAPILYDHLDVPQPGAGTARRQSF